MDVERDLLPSGSVARRLDRELFLLLGGTAALLMQVSHPLVAAGVERHSDFRRDPVGRLRRTLNTTLAVVFAEPDAARAALRRIDRRHGPVRGVAADGRAYDARDPALLLWVQSTLVLTSLRLYELVAGRLAAADREAYWQETRPIAAALGIPTHLQPRTIADLQRYYAAVAPFYDDEMAARTDIPLWRDLVARMSARSVLDLGTGGGRVARALADRAEVIGIDLLTALIPREPGFEFVQADLRELPF